MQPQVPIDVDEQSGIWTTDGLPMIYLPRHFFINNHQAVISAIGRDEYADHLYQAGYKSAYFWCDSEAALHGLNGMEVFHHYLKRLSQRGWGLIELSDTEIISGRLGARLSNSVFVLQHQKDHGDTPLNDDLCFMFCGWLAGAADWVAKDLRLEFRFSCHESRCACQGEKTCHFEICAISTEQQRSLSA